METVTSPVGELETWSLGLARLRRAALAIVYAEEQRPAEAIVRAAALLFEADAVVIRVPDELRSGSGLVVASHGLAAMASRSGPPRVSISRVEDIAIARDRSVIVPSIVDPGLPLPGGLGRSVSTAMITPLRGLADPTLGGSAFRRTVDGVLVIASTHQDRTFTAVEAELAETFANACGHVLRNDHRMAALIKAHDESVQASSHDTLTGFANRPWLIERLSNALERARASNAMVAVVFIDLDDFRLVNEHYGHEVGDRLLVAFSSRLRRILRSDEFAARLAVDEFVVVLEDIDDEIYGHLLVERVRIALGQPFQLGEASVLADASFGLAFASGRADHAIGAPELLHNANVALYRAKEEGKARSVVFDASIRDRTLAERDLASNLRSAVRGAPTDGSGPLELYYQPVVDLATGAVASVEALLRWHGATHDISPDDFIPIAETSGLIAPLGRWVLESACRHLARFRMVSPELGIGINLSGRQLADLSIVSDVAHAIRSAGLPADAVTLEVTETYLLERSEMAIRCLADLREIGVKTALDDFGTGYSSLTSLRLFRFDVCKVDRAFVQGLDGTGSDRALGEMLIGVARQLGMRVVGEGVETPSQLERLKDLGCDYGQGFHLGHPMPAEQLLVHLAQQCATRDS